MNNLPTTYQNVIHKSKYARYTPELGRRESYVETVDRYINYMYQQVKKQNISEEKRHELYLILGATCNE